MTDKDFPFADAPRAVAGAPTEPTNRPEVSQSVGYLRSAASAGSETRAERVESDANAASAESGAAVPDAVPLTRRQKFRLVGLVILKRVRFIAILVLVGAFIGYWDTVKNYWDKLTRPRTASVRELEPGQEFYCPMDPQVVRSGYEPNGDVPKCPICGMPLSERKRAEAAKLPAGVTGRVQLSPERIQLAGIKTVPVDYRPVVKEIKTVGYVTFDESRLSRIVSRVEGYVEKLYVDKTFAMVHEGDPLAEIYSPELYTTVEELALASRSGGSRDLAASARRRLQLLGVSPADIDAIEKSGQPSPRLLIRSPRTGYVVDKKIVVGASVEAKMTLLEVADLSAVWVEAEVYEKDISFLRPGQKVEATVEAYPHGSFTGKLALIYPQVEATTRTNRIRLELDNPGHELRPGMFATVRIQTPLENVEPFRSIAAKSGRVTLTGLTGTEDPARHEFLVVPERAVIDTGSKKVVYVEREPGMFEGVEVELGSRNGEYYPVIAGLNAGDKVAAAGGFLIDAETRLNPAAASTYFGASGGPQSSSPSNGRGSAPSAPGQRQGDHTPALTPSPSPKGRGEDLPESGRQAASEGSSPKPRVAVAAPTGEDLKNIEQLPEADRRLALKQRICPVTGAVLGSMGVPVKITLRGQPVFLCCKGCMGKAKRSPDEMLKILAELATEGSSASVKP